ncbi:pentatricopeptide repeat-containing protein At3g16610 [Phragmites australis]|uniref:pentatricopeptide repeat-containing protein At3g16610 n=1 Tax=Phragmites australis TaxID=29695 RepID=UPI002D7899A0|nr:pentatricopeptide repeat-containing protein At3g16610 [Phragmites australis]
MHLPRVRLRLFSTAAALLRPPPSGIISHEDNGKKGWQLELEQHIARGQLDLARQVFDGIPAPDVRAYNDLIRAYSWRGPFPAAIDLYCCMLRRRVAPNKYTFPFVLKACSALADLHCGRAVHRHAAAAGLHTDLFVSTALIDLYIRCARFGAATNVFAQMPTRDVVAWNAMLAGYTHHGMYGHAIAHLLDMQTRAGLRPNASTLVSLLPLLAQYGALSQGTSVHAYCLRACLNQKEERVLVGTALLDMYAKCKHLVYACRVFHGMPVRNEVTWSALIGGFVLYDRLAEAFSLFKDMLAQGGQCFLSPTSVASALRVCASHADLHMGTQLHALLAKSGIHADVTAGNSLLSMYAKAGLGEATKLFDEMAVKDTVSYGALLSGYVQNGNAEEAFLVFKKMQDCNVEPDFATMVSLIPACSHLAALQHGRCSHGSVITRGLASETSICNALIDMYAKCGRIDLSRQVFDKMLAQDIVSWNTMIAGYGIHGLGKEATTLFLSMKNQGFAPDDVTFICLISACSHSGLVTEGKHWFHTMTHKYGILPRMEHYICMVDLLARGGFLDEAYQFIQSMPLKADVRVWGALLGACRIHKNIDLGKRVSRMIQKLGPEGTGNFVLLSNIFSAAGRFDEAAEVRVIQKVKGFKKSPGCSWIEINGSLHAFVGGDQSHSRSPDIYQELDNILIDIKKLGYQADTSFVLQDLEEEEKEKALLYHSEKLAIAFGILSLSEDKTIFVTKNLRVCGDCHTAIKYMTLVRNRAIIVRDANRFHHFKNGQCSCEDFW